MKIIGFANGSGNLGSIFYFYVFFLLTSCPWQLKCRVLTTGLQGIPFNLFFKLKYL